MSNDIAELAFDLHTGLGTFQVPDFDELRTIGMAATVAIHIKGLGEVDYELLRKVSEHFMSVPSAALNEVLRLLQDVGFVKLIERGRRIDRVIPNVPVFDDVYDTIADFATSECEINECEETAIAILRALQSAPQNRDALYNALGVEKALFDRCLEIGASSGIVSHHKARGRPILISPFYFTDNLSGLADAAVSAGASTIQSVLDKVKDNQGWPISLLESTKEIGGDALQSSEIAVLRKLSQEGILKPPTIQFGQRSESFVFTPRPGGTRLNAANREIYERAMALVSAVRKGQLLPRQFRIHSPLALLRALRDRGHVRANSEADVQYKNLGVLRIAHLKRVSGGRWELHLIDTPENKKALDLAISLLQTGSLSNMEVNEEARIALTKGERYVQSLISASELKKRQYAVNNEQAVYEFDQLLLGLN